MKVFYWEFSNGLANILLLKQSKLLGVIVYKASRWLSITIIWLLYKVKKYKEKKFNYMHHHFCKKIILIRIFLINIYQKIENSIFECLL